MTVTTIRVPPDGLPQACGEVVRRPGRFVTMVASDEWENGRDRFVLRYVFQTAGQPDLTVVETVVPDSHPRYPSVTPLIPAAAWAEREAYDLLGIEPVGHPDPRPLVVHDNWPEGVYPLRRDYPLAAWPEPAAGRPWRYPQVEGAGVFEVPVGPIHAGVIEPGHFRFQVMGDSVLHLEARLFYTHRGIEKRGENMGVSQGLFLAERICGVCSVSHALSYAEAVEMLAGTDVPARARYLRVLFAELERVYNHVGDVGNMCAGIGYAYGSNHGARLKERLMQLNDEVAGHRFLRGSVALGGVGVDVPRARLEEVARVLRVAEAEFGDLVEQILANDIVVNRFRGTGVLSEAVVRDFAAVGPTARASHYDVDVRRDRPYAAYPELSFDVPVLSEGDVLARFTQRVLEARQSFRLIEQVINRMPDGAVRVAVGDMPPYGYGIGLTESPRGENVHFVMAGPNNTIARWRVRSAAYANWPVVPFSVPGNIVPDFPLINKSFELCYACCDR